MGSSVSSKDRWLSPEPAKTRTQGVRRPEPRIEPPENPRAGRPGAIGDDEVLFEALQKNAGLVAQTAEALGVSYQAVYQRVKGDPRWQEIIDEARMKVCDIGEAHYINKVRTGDMKAVDRFMRYHAKDRGYTTRHEIGGPNGGPIPVAGVDVTVKLVRASPGDDE